jgi:hypothetical protein
MGMDGSVDEGVLEGLKNECGEAIVGALGLPPKL